VGVSLTVRLCTNGVQRAGPAFARDFADRVRRDGISVQLAPCLDRCQDCEKGFVAQVDGAFTSAPSARAFLELLHESARS
jgi:hypothetical protein